MLTSPRRYLITYGPSAHRQHMTAAFEDVGTLVRVLLDNRCPHVEISEVEPPATNATSTFALPGWTTSGHLRVTP